MREAVRTKRDLNCLMTLSFLSSLTMAIPGADLRIRSVTSADSLMIEHVTGNAGFSLVSVNVCHPQNQLMFAIW